jgi:hypothetical protein
MATELHLDPELAAVVDRAKQRAIESGELPRGPFRPFQSSLSPEEAEVISEWLRDGGYDEAIAQIVSEDPDLANQ